MPESSHVHILIHSSNPAWLSMVGSSTWGHTTLDRWSYPIEICRPSTPQSSRHGRSVWNSAKRSVGHIYCKHARRSWVTAFRQLLCPEMHSHANVWPHLWPSRRTACRPSPTLQPRPPLIVISRPNRHLHPVTNLAKSIVGVISGQIHGMLWIFFWVSTLFY